MKRTLLIAACFLYVTAAPAQTVQDPNRSMQPSTQTQKPSMGERTGADSALGVTPSTEEFVKDVALSDMFELSSSKLAAERGDSKTKTFANQMLKDHQKTTGELTALIKSNNISASPPSKLDPSHQKKLDKLKNLQGEEFDKQYGQDQVNAHETAVSLFQRYAKGGDNQALKDWAAKTAPTLDSHLQMAQALSQ